MSESTSPAMTKVFIYIISDGTGETAMTMTKAALVHYTSHDLNIVRCKNIRNERQVDATIEEAVQKKSHCDSHGGESTTAKLFTG